MSTKTTKELLRAVATGDQPAFTALYRGYRERVTLYLQRIVRRRSAAEELADDALLEVWKHANEFGSRSKVSTWIFGIARHKALNRLRRKSLPRARISAAGALSDPGDAADSRLRRRELRAQLDRALATLPAVQREVLELAFYEGFSYHEIAEILRCPVNTVKTRAFHAKERLRETLARLGLTSLLP